MRYHIDTIPVWDAYHEESECPLCLLQAKAESGYVDLFLGGSVMEPKTRMEVNEKGFCSRHFGMLYRAQNRLGLALITHTYLKQTMEEWRKQAAKSKGTKDDLHRLSQWLRQKTESCMICEKTDSAMDRYAYTILHLWQHDGEFREALQSSKGFCLPHLGLMLNMAAETLKKDKAAAWMDTILPIQEREMGRVTEELWWFTQKFDHKNRDKSWGESKDALPRSIQKLSGENTRG